VHPTTSIHRKTSYVVQRHYAVKKSPDKKKKLKRSNSELAKDAEALEKQKYLQENYRPS
jgi:hypothetical protein